MYVGAEQLTESLDVECKAVVVVVVVVVAAMEYKAVVVLVAHSLVEAGPCIDLTHLNYRRPF